MRYSVALQTHIWTMAAKTVRRVDNKRGVSEVTVDTDEPSVWTSWWALWGDVLLTLYRTVCEWSWTHGQDCSSCCVFTGISMEWILCQKVQTKTFNLANRIFFLDTLFTWWQDLEESVYFNIGHLILEWQKPWRLHASVQPSRFHTISFRVNNRKCLETHRLIYNDRWDLFI